MKTRNLTEESTIPEDIVHIDRNANIRKNEDISYTSNTEPTQNPRYNCSNYSTRYNRFKSIQTQVKKKELNLLRKGPKFTPTTKGNILKSKIDILNLTRRLQLEEILHEKNLTTSQCFVINRINNLKPKI